MLIALHIAFIFQNIAIISAFMSSLKVRDGLSFQIKSIKLYVTIAFLFVILTSYGSYFETDKSFILGVTMPYLSVIFHFGLLSFFLGKSIYEVNNNKFPFIVLIFSLFILFGIVFALFHNGKIEFYNYSKAVSSFGLLVLCMVYFFSIIKDQKQILYIDDFSFWIAIGIFVSMGVVLPSSIITKIISKHSKEVTLFLRVVTLVAFGVQYIFFTKAFLWKQRKLKT